MYLHWKSKNDTNISKSHVTAHLLQAMFIDVTFEKQKQMWCSYRVRLHLLQGNILLHEGVVADNGFELLFIWESLSLIQRKALAEV